MRKKNGFTLVELLAVIVVLALIMIIAIPAILDVMNSARKESFAQFASNAVRETITQYTYDAHTTIAGAGVYVYNIEKDLGRLSTGNYKGYVVVDALNVDDPRYILTMYDNNYQIINYDTSRGLPTTAEVDDFNAGAVSENAKSEIDACRGAAGESQVCYNRQGLELRAN